MIRNRLLLTSSEQILLPFAMATKIDNTHYRFELPTTFVLSDQEQMQMGDGWVIEFSVHSMASSMCFIAVSHPICAPVICANRNLAIACTLSDTESTVSFTPCLTLKSVCVDAIELCTLDVNCEPKTVADVSRIVLSCCISPK